MGAVQQYSRPTVVGGAQLVYERLPEVGTRLTEQWVRPPLHMTKAYIDQSWAISQVMSPTAGLLQGDLLELDVTVKADAYAAVISPAACRVHTMEAGRARVRQTFRVESGGALDIWPAPLILQKEASLLQETRVEVASDATLLLCEIISPGRAAFGEAFEFKQWVSRLRIYRSDTLVSLENFTCDPAQGGAEDWRQLYPNGNYASLYFLTPADLGGAVEQLHELDVSGAVVGASALRGGGLGVKLLAQDGVSLRATIEQVRELLLPLSPVPFPNALQRAQTFFY